MPRSNCIFQIGLERAFYWLVIFNFQMREDYVIRFFQLGWGSCIQNPLVILHKNKVTVDGVHLISDILESTRLSFTKTAAVSLV
jgi:hypothetical protein